MTRGGGSFDDLVTVDSLDDCFLSHTTIHQVFISVVDGYVFTKKRTRKKQQKLSYGGHKRLSTVQRATKVCPRPTTRHGPTAQENGAAGVRMREQATDRQSRAQRMAGVGSKRVSTITSKLCRNDAEIMSKLPPLTIS